MVLAATILDTGDTGANCLGDITDSGYSLSNDGSGNLSGIGPRNNASLNLGPLADNGGPTPTHLPGAGRQQCTVGQHQPGVDVDGERCE